MRQDEWEALTPELRRIADEAGNAILSVYNSAAIETQLKTDQSPVTNADLAAHRVLAEGLGALLSNCPVVSEEDEASWQSRQKTGRFWLIDPLDGTKEFLARNGEFTINIALIERGRSVCGLVYAPALALMYWGGAGLGAFCRRQNAPQHPIAVSRCNKNAHEPCRVIISRSNLNAETQTFINRLGATELVSMGSSLKFCHIAEGGADIYPRLGPTCEWDTAAAQAVLEGAGGAVVEACGRQPLRYGKAETLNPFFIATRDVALIPHD